MLCKVIIELEIECTEDSDAFYVVDEALDSGTLQDAINEYETDGDYVRVVSAISKAAE